MKAFGRAGSSRGMHWRALTHACILTITVMVSTGASCDRSVDKSSEEQAETFALVLRLTREWRTNLESVLAALQTARDAIASDMEIADAIRTGDRIQLTAAMEKHAGLLSKCDLLIYDEAAVPIALLHCDAAGRASLDRADSAALVARECRAEIILDVYALDAPSWIAIMDACEDERARFEDQHLLIAASPIRNGTGGTVGGIALIEGMERVDRVLSAAQTAGKRAYHLSIVNWDGVVIDDDKAEAVPAWLRPPIDSLPALSNVAFDARDGLFVGDEKLAMLILPIAAMSEEGKWTTSLLFCADPILIRELVDPDSSASQTDVREDFQLLVLAAGLFLFGVGAWFVARRRLLVATLAVRAASEEAVSERNRLISGVSHDIRGPLGAIIGFAELIRTDPGYREEGVLRANAFDAIKRSCNFILRLTDHLLDLRSAAMGRLVLESRFTDVLAICEECVSLYSIEAREKGITLFFSHPNIDQLQIMSDPTRLRQIVQNLVGNAVRYSDHGSVALAVWIPDPTREEIEISVSDTGIGISTEVLAKIFAPFYREKRPESAPRAGTGLGLAVVKTIVDALGGSIQVTSERGKGSMFVVRLQAPRWVETDQSVSVTSTNLENSLTTPAFSDGLPLEGMSIAFADDYAEAREITGRVLRSGGAIVTAFVSGTDLVHAVQCGLQVDCVLLDLQMPGLSGHATAKVLRKSGFAGPMVALSALAHEATRQHSAASGFAEHLSKPTDGAQLQRVIAKLIAQHRCAK